MHMHEYTEFRATEWCLDTVFNVVASHPRENPYQRQRQQQPATNANRISSCFSLFSLFFWEEQQTEEVQIHPKQHCEM